jgi:hypothetical protein
MDDFLSTARNDLSLSPTQSKIDFLKENNFNGPWVSRVEFRTRSNNANLSQEDFRFRVTPGNPGELKANKRYYDKQVVLLNIEYQDELNNALLNRYSLAIDHVFEFRKKENLNKQLGINRKLIDLMSKGGGTYSVDMGDLIDVQSDELDMMLAMENSKINIDEIEYMIKDFYEYSGNIDWEQTDIIGIDDILNLFAEFKNKPSGQHINLVKMEQKNNLAAERFNIEKSERLNNIGYFQAEYDTDRGNEPYDHFGYQIGIRIPIVNPDKPQLNRRKLALMDDEALLDEKKDDFRKSLELAVLRMDNYNVQYNEINKKLDHLSKQNFLALKSPGKSIKMSDMIKMNQFYIDLLDKKNSVEKKIYLTYLEYLNLNGKLTEAPMRNYLSKNLSEF